MKQHSKHYLGLGAALAAFALTTGAGLAQAGNQVNSTVPGSPGYTGAAATHTSKMKAITKKQNAALNHGGNKLYPTSDVPGSPQYMGQKPAGVKGAGTPTVAKAKVKSTQTNSTVPGSPGYTGAAEKPGS